MLCNATQTPQWRRCRMALAALLLALLAWVLAGNSPTPAQAPTCAQPSDSDIAMAFCDAANDDIADAYAYPLYDVSTDGYIPPIILKAIGGAESEWLQCRYDGTPVSSPDGCAWGLMQIHSGRALRGPGPASVERSQNPPLRNFPDCHCERSEAVPDCDLEIASLRSQ